MTAGAAGQPITPERVRDLGHHTFATGRNLAEHDKAGFARQREQIRREAHRRGIEECRPAWNKGDVCGSDRFQRCVLTAGWRVYEAEAVRPPFPPLPA